MPTSVTCSGCGSAVPSGDRFCGTCGNPITGSALISGENSRFDPWTELLQKLRNATLGEYEIKGELGRGGMAAVFLAHDLQLNRRVAVKVMLPGLAYGERMWDRFLAEARTAAKLDHPNIVYVHSVKEKDRFLYFVMKHIDGRSLDGLLAEHNAFPIPVAQTILAEVARALDYAHREGVIHRDIKPANIMVDQKGNSIVMDFGIARAAETEHFTQTGATIGTPAYMSPEQCHGYETSAASDQYSLGILAYELLTGLPPFVGTPIELQVAHMQDVPIPIRDRRSELSLELSGAVMRMLAKDPAERWPTLQALVPVFARGLDAHDDAPRTELIAMVKSGMPRRNSFPATPISPMPAGMPAGMPPTPAKSYPARNSSDTMPVSAIGDIDSPPATAGSSRAGSPGADAPIAVSSAASELMWRAEDAAAAARAAGLDRVVGVEGVEEDEPAEVPADMPRRSLRTATIVGAIVVLAGVGAIALGSGNRSAPIDTRAAAIASTPQGGQLAGSAAIGAGASALAAPTPLPGDSAASGMGAATAGAKTGKTLRDVVPDAVALLQLTMPRSRVSIGDTVRVKLTATDDAGAEVTTSQVAWTTSNASVIRFAGAGAVIAAGLGKATITVTAGGTTATREITVVAKKR